MGEVIPFPKRPATEPALPLFLVARHFNVTLRTVQRWVREGCPTQDDGRVRLSDVHDWLDRKGAA